METRLLAINSMLVSMVIGRACVEVWYAAGGNQWPRTQPEAMLSYSVMFMDRRMWCASVSIITAAYGGCLLWMRLGIISWQVDLP